VILESQADSEQLRFLMAHDRDPFSRWEAGQSYATRLMLKMIGRQDQGLALEPDAGLADAFARTLGDRDLNRAFVAQTLQLPAESYVGQQMAVIDVDRIHEVRAYLRRALGEALFERFDAVYRAQQTNEPYRLEAGAMGRRALKNLALAYLAASRRKAGLAAAEAQFEQADNMTDSIAALAQIVEHGEAATREAALSSFYQRWQDEGLVVDKWFVLQAVAQRPDSLPRVERLMAHPAFKMTNPNRVRSLIGAFAMGNPTGFHHASGDGYRFVADRVIELDRLNPQIAARLLGVFGRWQRYDAARQALMKAELERILAVPKLSRNSFEVASKSLG
jgi:aminopeptidase N